MSTKMDSETTANTSKDDKSHSDLVPTKQQSAEQSTSQTSQKLRNLKVVLFKLNVGKCFPLPGKVGFSTEYPITAINFGKHQVPGSGKAPERKSKRVSEQAPCCLTCADGNTCTKKAKPSELVTKKRKYVRRKKPESGERQARKRHDPSDFLPTMCRTSNLEAHPDQWVDQDRISTLFLGKGLLQTLHTAGNSGTITNNQFAPSVGVGNRTAQAPGNHEGHPSHTFIPEMSRGPLYQRNTPGLPPPGGISSQAINTSVIADSQFLRNASSGRSQAWTSIYPTGFYEKRNQVTIPNSNTVHVMFSRENVLGQRSSAIDVSTWTLDTSQGYPGMGSWVAQFIPNSAVPLANTGTPSMQQSNHAPFAASTTDKGLPLNLKNSVHSVLPQRHPVALPVYAPAPYPVFLNPRVGNRFLPVTVEGMTVLPVYLSVTPPRPLPVATTSRQGVATCSSSVGVGSRFTARGHVSTSASIISPVASQSVSTSQGTSRHRRQQSTVHVQLASERVAPTTTNSQTDVGLACLQMSKILKQVLKDKRLSGDYGFLIDQYRSALEQEPNNTVAITDEKSLLHFLKITESHLRANALALEKKSLTFQALTEKYQEDILKEGEKYRQAMRRKTVAEENISAIEEKIKGRWKQRSFTAVESEMKELEAKLETLKNEKATLQEKWSNYEKNLPSTALENQPQS